MASGAGEQGELLRAGDGRDEDSTGIRIGAGLASLLYTPTKVAYASLGVVVGGLGWIFSGGDGQVALDIMQPSFRGDYLIRPTHLRGTEPIRFVGRSPASEQAVVLAPAPAPVPGTDTPRPDAEVPGPSPELDEPSTSTSTRTNASTSERTSKRPAEDASFANNEKVSPTSGDTGVGPDRATEPRPSGEQIRPTLSRRAGDESGSAARTAGATNEGLPAVSSPPPSRTIEETGEAGKVGEVPDVVPTSGTGSADRPAAAAVEQTRWDVQRDLPDRGREEEAARDLPDRDGVESAWPRSRQVDSTRWKKDARGVWVYEAP